MIALEQPQKMIAFSDHFLSFSKELLVIFIEGTNSAE